MLYNPSLIATSDFVAASATATTASLVTIPASRYFCFEIQISGSQSGLGTATPAVTLKNTAGGTPGASVVVAELSITGVIGAVSGSSSNKTVVGYSGTTGATLDFALNGATASCTIGGFLQ